MLSVCFSREILQHITIASFIWISIPPLASCGRVEYYFIPTLSSGLDCPLGKVCHTLNNFALLYSTQLSNRENDVSLFFLNGVHNLDYDLTMSGSNSLSLTTFNNYFDFDSSNNSDYFGYSVINILDIQVDIYVDVRSQFQLDGASSLTIKNIHFLKFFVSPFESQKIFLQAPTIQWTLVTFKDCDLTITANSVDVIYSDFTNTGIFINMFRNIVFNGVRNTIIRFYYTALSSSTINYFGNYLNYEIEYFNFTVDHCLMSSENSFSSLVYKSSRSSINVDVGSRTNANIDIVDTTMTATTEEGWLSISAGENNEIALRVHNCKLFQTRVGIITKTNNSIEVHVSDSTISNLGGKGCSIRMTSANRLIVTIVSTLFSANLEILIENTDLADLKHSLTDVPDRITCGNSLYRSTKAMVKSGSFVLLDNVTVDTSNVDFEQDPVAIRVLNSNIMIRDCILSNNRGTTVQAYFSTVVLSGNTVFTNNSGIEGGALSLYQSKMMLVEPFHISFISNNAEKVGGAIFVKLVATVESPTSKCFYQVALSESNSTGYQLQGKVIFQNNFANNGGDNVYGASIHSNSCLRANMVGNDQKQITTIFHSYNETTWSPVSSDPTRVCLCDEEGVPQCEVLDYIYSIQPPRFPGEHFTVPVVLVGYEFGTVSGIVYSFILDGSESVSVGDTQNVQEIRQIRQCSPLNFTIESPTAPTTQSILLSARQYTTKERSETLALVNHLKQDKTEFLIKDIYYHQPVIVSVLLEDCPIGFNVSAVPPHVCKCHEKLEQNGINRCIISNHRGLIYRSGTAWVSASFDKIDNNSFLVHQVCPYGYCKPQNISVDLRYPDKQCDFYHSGTLCGGCQGNLSLALGTSRCLSCSGSYVALLIVFVFAGVFLVFFIKLLDLTVANGTINGLILYANIIWANHSTFFPREVNSEYPALQILNVFIAWLNLDLGIETCFIPGLNAYWKTWLQFVFPLYIWSITGLMIISAHYSTRASKILGNNSVPVLATLILLSYAKLLRSIITCLVFSLLEYPQEGTRVVWSYDGNVPYFGAAHSILLAVALSALLFLWLPFTLVLLTVRWLRRKAHLRPLRWINRWKPFFDAYLGQLKPTHQYSFGLLLLVRVFLLVLFSITSSIVPRLNILAITITGVGLIVLAVLTGLFYKSLCLSVVEGTFIVNLTLLGIIKLYTSSAGDTHSIAVYVSVTIALVQFLVIVIYHMFIRIRSSYLTNKRRCINTEQQETDREREMVTAANVNHNNMEYREPLLDSIG